MPKSKLADEKTLIITLVKSPIGFTKSQKATVSALGLRHLHQSVTQKDNSALRGMLAKVNHLVKVEEVAKVES